MLNSQQTLILGWRVFQFGDLGSKLTLVKATSLLSESPAQHESSPWYNPPSSGKAEIFDQVPGCLHSGRARSRHTKDSPRHTFGRPVEKKPHEIGVGRERSTLAAFTIVQSLLLSM
jgi:hypothetical protein